MSSMSATALNPCNLITEDGAEITSDFAPMDMGAIEELMREPGMLQRHPRAVFRNNR